MDGKLLTIVKVTVFVLLLLTSSTLVLTNEVKVTALSGPEFDYQYINGDAEVEITGYHGTDGQVSIPSSIDGKPVTSIADYSFSYLSTINSIQIPGSITNIGLYSFYSCPSLLSFEVDSSNPSYTSVDGVLYDKAVSTLYLCPPGRSEALTIPDTVTTIGPSSCSDCLKLKEVSIPTSVTTIGDYSFYRNTALAVLNLPEGIIYIGYSCFRAMQLTG